MSQPPAPYPKRLIEVDLPIKEISAHARREKSIRHGHISTLHLWWARRPLAACRAVLCASLWPDPADENCPQTFRDEAAKILYEFAEKVRTDKQVMELCVPHWARWKATDKVRLASGDPACWWDMRYALFDFIADFANWDATTIPAFVDTASRLTVAANLAAKPMVMDPFAGGGSIPLEALRVGADVYSSDLNPIPILLNEVVLRHMPRFGARLAECVREYAEWVQAQARQELAPLYPASADGKTPIAYVWARVARCEGPGCGAHIPLLKSLWLSKRAERLAAFRLLPNKARRTISAEIVKPAKASVALPGTVNQGAMTCPLCGYTTPKPRVRDQLLRDKGGAASARLMAVVVPAQVGAGREYRLPSDADLGWRVCGLRSPPRFPTNFSRLSVSGRTIRSGFISTGQALGRPVRAPPATHARDVRAAGTPGAQGWAAARGCRTGRRSRADAGAGAQPTHGHLECALPVE